MDDFAEFVSARSAALLRTAWLLTGDERLAEDLLQTALAASWRRWRRVSAGANPEAYVRKVLLTTFLSWRRRRWRGELPFGTLPEPGGGGDHASGVGDRDAVRRALARLSPQQRAVVVLRYAQDCSVAATALPSVPFDRRCPLVGYPTEISLVFRYPDGHTLTVVADRNCQTLATGEHVRAGLGPLALFDDLAR
jgi:RNA polymerase sigma-70 factor (sigma-E family)